MEFLKKPLTDTLTELLINNPKIDFFTVINHKDLNSSIRNNSDQLVNFLTTEENLRFSFSIIFKKINLNDNIEKIASRNIVSLYCSIFYKLQENLKNNLIFIELLNNFLLLNEINNDPIIFGNFSRIFEIYIRLTKGEILNYFNNFEIFLINRINLLASRDLLICLLTEFSTLLSISIIESIYLNLIEGFKKKNSYFYVSTLLFSIKEKNNFINLLQNKEIIIKLMESSIILQSDLFLIDFFKLIKILINDKPQLKQLVLTYNNYFKFDNNNIKTYTPFLLLVFDHNIKIYLTNFFENSSNIFLNESILNIIYSFDDFKLINFIKETNLLNLIIDKFNNEKINGNLFELANYCCLNKSVIQNCRGWFRFKDNFLLPYLLKRNSRI